MATNATAENGTDTDSDDVECACDLGDPGCFDHYEVADEDETESFDEVWEQAKTNGTEAEW